jgi:hypothetical protein
MGLSGQVGRVPAHHCQPSPWRLPGWHPHLSMLAAPTRAHLRAVAGEAQAPQEGSSHLAEPSKQQQCLQSPLDFEYTAIAIVQDAPRPQSKKAAQSGRRMMRRGNAARERSAKGYQMFEALRGNRSAPSLLGNEDGASDKHSPSPQQPMGVVQESELVMELELPPNSLQFASSSSSAHLPASAPLPHHSHRHRGSGKAGRAWHGSGEPWSPPVYSIPAGSQQPPGQRNVRPPPPPHQPPPQMQHACLHHHSSPISARRKPHLPQEGSITPLQASTSTASLESVPNGPSRRCSLQHQRGHPPQLPWSTPSQGPILPTAEEVAPASYAKATRTHIKALGRALGLNGKKLAYRQALCSTLARIHDCGTVQTRFKALQVRRQQVLCLLNKP